MERGRGEESGRDGRGMKGERERERRVGVERGSE